MVRTFENTQTESAFNMLAVLYKIIRCGCKVFSFLFCEEGDIQGTSLIKLHSHWVAQTRVSHSFFIVRGKSDAWVGKKKSKLQETIRPEKVHHNRSSLNSQHVARVKFRIETWFSLSVRHWARDIYICVYYSQVWPITAEKGSVQRTRWHTRTTSQGQHDRHVTITVYLQRLWTHRVISSGRRQTTMTSRTCNALTDWSGCVWAMARVCACIYWIPLLK